MFMFVLEVSFTAPDLKENLIDVNKFQLLLRQIEQEDIESLPERRCLISLIFTDSEKIQELNKQYRGKNAPTDVLSFSLYDENSPEEVPLFGEIYISLPTAKKQAKSHDQGLQKELNTLFVHGVLHLLGYDHQTNTEFNQMNALEKKILK